MKTLCHSSVRLAVTCRGGPPQRTLSHGWHSVRTTTSAAEQCYGGGGGEIKNRAGHLFRLAAFSLHHSPTPLGNYLRRMKAKLGPKAATMATAHKIALIFYTMVKNQVEYDETIWATRDSQREKRLEAKIKRQAKQLGYELVPIVPKAA